MAAIAHTTGAGMLIIAHRRQRATTATHVWEEPEFNRFGFVALLLVVMVCTGGLAAAVAVNGAAWKLMTVAFAAVVVQFLVMTVAPMRLIVFAAALALLADLVVFLT